MHKPLSLRKNFTWTLVGTFVGGGAQWAMLIVLTKFLSPAEVGYYLLGLAITSPVVLFSTLDLRVVQATDAQNLHEFEDFLGVRLLTNVIAILIIFAILGFLRGRYSYIVLAVILAIGINKVIETTSDIVYGLMQKKERLDKMAQSLILRNIGAFFFLGVVVLITKSLLLSVLSIGFWWIIVLFFFDKRNAEKFHSFIPRLKLESMLSIILTGLPLGIAGGFMTLYSNMNRYFIEGYLGSESLAYFGAMAYAVVAASQITTALGQSASPRLAQYYVFNRKAFLLLLGKMLMIALAMAFITVMFGVFFGKPFLAIIYGDKYAQHQDVFLWLLIATSFSMIASMLGFGMSAARCFKSQIPLFMVVFMVSFPACWLLIPRYGMKGAAWSMIIASITQCIGTLIVILMGLKSKISLGACDAQDAIVQQSTNNAPV